jgi:hypothetical protein
MFWYQQCHSDAEFLVALWFFQQLVAGSRIRLCKGLFTWCVLIVKSLLACGVIVVRPYTSLSYNIKGSRVHL